MCDARHAAFAGVLFLLSAPLLLIAALLVRL
jgi:hypothetical protein